MKKLLVIILAALMLLSFIGCKKTTDNKTNDDSDINKSPDSTTNGNTDSDENSDGTANGNTDSDVNNGNEADEDEVGDQNASGTSESISEDDIAKVFGVYNEGIVFIKKKGDNEKLYCIDKNGKIEFSIVASSAGSFCNGLALTNVGVCDKNGNITTARDLGGDEIVKCDFSADYILVRKSTTSFTGTVNELATYNNKFEKIVDFSSEFYDVYNEYDHCTFVGGYIPFYDYDDRYLNLYTGKVVEGKKALYDEMTAKEGSNYWNRDGYWGSVGGFYIYNGLEDYLGSGERTPIIDLSQDPKYATIDHIGEFENGMAPIIFKVEDGDGNYVFYYTIMDESGEYKFDPVQLGGGAVDSQYAFENGYFVCNLCVGGWWASSRDRRIEVYDASGNMIAQTDYELSDISQSTSIKLSDGIIILKISRIDENYYLYNINLESIL